MYLILVEGYIRSCANSPQLQQDAPARDLEGSLCKISETSNYEVFTGQNGPIWAKKKGTSDISWVPLSDQLAGLIKKKKFVPYGQLNDLKLDLQMRIIVSKIYCYSGCSSLTFPEMWITFYMSEVYKKRWVTDRQEWEDL